ncbi:MAG: carbohydrate binding family 9 domain-containing protein [Acidobacteria bacterium]|nr:carbohydrate binding family 9 domain-containing protein [Acidobacteriota bacterium]
MAHVPQERWPAAGNLWRVPCGARPAMRRLRTLLRPGMAVAFGIVTIGFPAAAYAQATPETQQTADRAVDAGVLTGRPVVRPPRLAEPPVIDGRLDEPLWRDAAHITQLVQRRPFDGIPASEPSDIYLAYDSANIYVGLYAHYSNPGMIRANRRDRDESIDDDLFLIYFDPFLDQQRAYVFTVNGYGVQGDAILQAGALGGGRFGVPRGDASWDVLFDSAAELVDDGFVAELAIPFKSLRYPRREAGAPHRWGLQIARIIGGRDEADVWSPTSRDIAGFLPQMGVLEGMTDLSRSHNLELLPTFTTIRFGSLDRATGRFRDRDPSPEGGLNLKYGVTSNLTADVTFNPDFSQVESDLPQIEVNQRFALFYPELRPFFLEGAEIFSVRAPVTAVHTRRIVDPAFGAKLTGKVGRTSVGVLYASDAEPGNLDDATDAAFGSSADTFVGRARYDLYAESHIGTIFTNRELLGGHSRLAGMDSNFRLGDTHSVAFRAMGTDHQDQQGAKTSGYLVDAVFNKRGRNLRYSLSSYALSPDFKTDVGFVRRTDQRYTSVTGGYRWWPENWLRNWGPEFVYGRNYDFAGVLQDEVADAGINFALFRNMFAASNVRRELERFGGIDFVKTRARVFGRVDTSRRVGVSLEYRRGEQILFHTRTPYLGREQGITARVILRPVPRLQSAVNVTTNRFTDPRRGSEEVFDVRIFRALTTYQFSNRLLFRNISEYNTLVGTLDLNFLLTYRVNAGTVLYAGYDDHYQQADLIDGDLSDWNDVGGRELRVLGRQRTNRAVFVKFQYLFRY